MFTLAYLAYLVLLIESVAVAILVFPYIPISVKKAFSRLLKKLFKNRHSSYIVSVLGAVFALLFIQSTPPPVPGVVPPPVTPDHVRAKYVNQRNAYISFFALYLLLLLWSLMKLFVTYKLVKITDEPPPLPPKNSSEAAEEKKKDQ